MPGLGLTLLLISPLLSAAPQPYVAKYEVLKNDKRIAETTVELKQTGHDRFHYQLSSKGTKGLARFLKLSNTEQSQFGWHDQRPVPQSFSSNSKVAGKRRATLLNFDWSSKTVTGEHDKTSVKLTQLPPETLDPITLNIAIQEGLKNGQTEWNITMVDKDSLEAQHYRVTGDEVVDTAMGCYPALRVERIRQNSRRATISWYAPQLNYLPVQIDRVKQGRERLRLRLREITLAGQPSPAGDSCK